MNKTIFLLFGALSLTSPAWASCDNCKMMSGDTIAQASPNSAAPATSSSMTDGQVTKVDAGTGKLTLRHGDIKNLDMPPMTMVFQVEDPAMLEKVKAGDKVRFTADRVNGVFTVTSLEVAN